MPDLNISDLLPPLNDREHRDRDVLERMADTIAAKGFLQAIRVSKDTATGKWRVRTGWTRVLAGRMAGVTTVPAIVVEGELDEADDLLEKHIENECRGNTNPLDRAKWDLRLIQLKGWSQAELARNTGQSPAQVAKDLAMFDGLVEELKEKVYSGDLKPRGAYALCRLPREQQAGLWAKIQHMKVEAIEEMVDRMLGKKPKKAKPVKIRTGKGLQAFFPALDHDAALAELALLTEGVRKLQRHGLPMSSLPSVLKN